MQQLRMLGEILSFDGWKVKDAYLERADGTRAEVAAVALAAGAAPLILVLVRRRAALCAGCLSACREGEPCETERWEDLPWGAHPVWIEAMPIRVRCKRCSTMAVELLPWADPQQRQTQRLQQRLAGLRGPAPKRSKR